MRTRGSQHMNEKGSQAPPHYRDAIGALRTLSDLLYESHSMAYQSVLDLANVLIDKDRRFVLYLGAGCSATARPPKASRTWSAKVKSWHGLLKGMFEEVPNQDAFLRELAQRAGWGVPAGKLPEFEEFYNVFDKQQLAWFLTQSLGGRKKRDEVISGLVEPKPGAGYDSELYDAVFDLPFSDIVTTNYDSHIVRFLEKKGRKFVEITDTKSIATASKGEGLSRVFYLHGRAGASSSLVLDKFDYAKLMTERDGMLDYVTFLLRDAHVLYVGFGLDDPTFNLMETRLQTLHGENRPLSFAFIPDVTNSERAEWNQRYLKIIDYDKRQDHRDLPVIIRCANTIREFVRWAEPERGKVWPKVGLNDDRTTDYWPDTLKHYVKGEFEAGLIKCRAALASTLFWKGERVGKVGLRPLPFNKTAKLCEIRIRMARFHYKLRWTEANLAVHDNPMKENLEDARTLLDDLRRYLRRSKSPDVNDDRVRRALDNSLTILDARDCYQKGHFERARALYAKVIESIAPEDVELGTGDGKPTLIAKLRLAEGYYYAKCQMSRLEYQFIDRGAQKRRRERGTKIDEMLRVVQEVDDVCKVLKSREETCKEYPEWEYYKNSLWTIRRISKWTAGRHAARVFEDLIPTATERTVKACDDLSDALGYLEDEMTDRQMKDLLWPLSARWPALRYRYRCRAYALRWLVCRHLNKRRCDDDLFKAFRALIEGFQRTEGPGLERERVINLLEAARLNIIAMFGEKRGRGSAGRDLSASPLTISAGVHYLDDAFIAIGRIKDRWLLALGYRLASYLRLIAGDELAALTSDLRSKELSRLLACKDAAAEVERQYRDFAEALGNPEAFKKRIKYFKRTFNSIKRELSDAARGKKATAGSVVVHDHG